MECDLEAAFQLVIFVIFSAESVKNFPLAEGVLNVGMCYWRDVAHVLSKLYKKSSTTWIQNKKGFSEGRFWVAEQNPKHQGVPGELQKHVFLSCCVAPWISRVICKGWDLHHPNLPFSHHIGLFPFLNLLIEQARSRTGEILEKVGKLNRSWR